MTARIVLFGGDRPLTRAIGQWLALGARIVRLTSSPADVEIARHDKPDLGVSVLYRHKLTPEVLALFPRGVVNLHLGYLPWNRGAMPNVWPIIDGTPAGVTLHWMDEGIDTGDIIAQRRVVAGMWDTGKTLYDRLCEAAYGLFVETWPSIADGTAPRVKQPEGGSYHRSRDVEAIDNLDAWSGWDACDVLSRIRARTFSPYRGCYFEQDGKRVYVRVELEEG